MEQNTINQTDQLPGLPRGYNPALLVCCKATLTLVTTADTGTLLLHDKTRYHCHRNTIPSSHLFVCDKKEKGNSRSAISVDAPAWHQFDPLLHPLISLEINSMDQLNSQTQLRINIISNTRTCQQCTKQAKDLADRTILS